MMERTQSNVVIGFIAAAGLKSIVKLPIATLICFLLSVTASLASDWEEDTPKVPLRPPTQATPAKDTVILDSAEPNSSAPAGVLQGNATATRTKTVQPSSSMLQAQFAERIAAVERIDADANSFLQSARVNAITPPAVFHAFIEKNHPEFSFDAENNSPESLLVVHGQWDDSTKPLHSLGLNFNTIKTKELADHSLAKCKVVIIDCAGELAPATIQKVRDFVGWGGYLLTTDWALKNVLEPCFPGFVQWNRDSTDGVVTDAFIVDTDTPLLAGLSGRRFTWKLDRMSECVRILNPARVHMLARSSRLSQQDPQLRVLSDPLLAGGLALEFSFGQGKVLHLVGHFDNCSNSFKPYLLPDPAPGAGISLRQALATNFIIEGLNRKFSKPSAETKEGK